MLRRLGRYKYSPNTLDYVSEIKFQGKERGLHARIALQNSAYFVAGGLPFLDEEVRSARRLRRPAIRLEAM